MLEDTGADVVVGFGGYVALPAYLAARGRVPIVIHEANATPGAREQGRRPVHPLRRLRGARRPPALAAHRHAAAAGDRGARPRRRDARRPARFFGLDPDRPTLLVFGGSQGARRLNDAAIVAAARADRAGDPGAARGRPAQLRPAPDRTRSGEAPYVAVPYLDRMDLAYAAADVALCRAGAMTCAELAAVGLPALYVPLPIGNGEQRLNALPVVRAGGGLLVEDAALDAERVLNVLGPLLLDDDQRREMESAAASHGQRDADERLRQLVLDAVAGTTGAGTDAGGRP